MLRVSKQMCTEFQQHFVVLFRVRSVCGIGVNFTSYHDGMSRLLARDAEFCKIPIRAEDLRGAMISCPWKMSPILYSLLFELYIHMS